MYILEKYTSTEFNLALVVLWLYLQLPNNFKSTHKLIGMDFNRCY